MEIEEAIDIIDKELHKKWDKTIEKKDGKTYIHLGDEEPLNEFEKASQRCLVEVQSLNRKIERLNNIINEFEDFITNVDSHINLGDESEEFILVRDKWLELQELKGS